MMQRVFGRYFLAVIFIYINVLFRGSWKCPECEQQGDQKRDQGEKQAATQALKEVDMKTLPYKSPAQFWPRLLAATMQYSAIQSEQTACKEQIHLAKTLEEPFPFGGDFRARVEQAGGPRPTPIGEVFYW